VTKTSLEDDELENKYTNKLAAFLWLNLDIFYSCVMEIGQHYQPAKITQ